jgi:hypothetical protein
MNKKDESLYKIGGVCAIGAAIFSIIYVITTIFSPLMQPIETDLMLMTILAEQGALHYLSLGAMAMVALLTMCTIPTISDLLRDDYQGWIQIGAIFGYMGFGVLALSSLVAPTYDLHLARAYLSGDEMTQAAIVQIMTVTNFDPAGWATFGPMGVWTFVAHWVALRKGAWPRKLAYLGIATAFIYWAVLIAIAFYFNLVAALIGVVGSLIIAPILYIWLGIFLIRQTGQQEKGVVSFSTASPTP